VTEGIEDTLDMAVPVAREDGFLDELVAFWGSLGEIEFALWEMGIK
jgi:hypothetical protein